MDPLSSSSSPFSAVPIVPTSPSPYHGCHVMISTNKHTAVEYYETHYNELNGGEVEWFEIYELVPNGGAYNLKIIFSSPLLKEEIINFVDLPRTIDSIVFYTKPIYFESSQFHKVMFSYEGVRSKTKSAAKLKPTQT